METKDRLQLAWGLALILMGVAFFFRFPYVLERVFSGGQSGIFHFFVKLCMILVSVILVGGGIKKLIHIQRVLNRPSSDDKDRRNA